jgi:CO dehydrogenase maturation factor
MCRAHATVRGLLQEMLAQTDGEHWTVVDLEAGVEVMSRGTPKAVDALLIIVEPYYRALELGRRLAELGQELGIPKVWWIANKLRTSEEERLIRAYADAHELTLAATLPFDEVVSRAEREGRALIQIAPDAPFLSAMAGCADRLLTGAA